MKNIWWLNLAKEIQTFADFGETRIFYESIKTAYEATYQVQDPLLASYGTSLITDRKSVVHQQNVLVTLLVTNVKFKKKLLNRYNKR